MRHPNRSDVAEGVALLWSLRDAATDLQGVLRDWGGDAAPSRTEDELAVDATALLGTLIDHAAAIERLLNRWGVEAIGPESSRLPRHAMSFERAFAEATTEQGLDAVVDALGAAGIPVVVEQTGGHRMVATVHYTDRSGWLGITKSDDRFRTDGDGTFRVCSYDHPESSGDVIADNAALAALVGLVSDIIG
jgi:hypothetical protein